MQFVAILIIVIFTSIMVLCRIKDMKNKKKKTLIHICVFYFMIFFFSFTFIEVYNMYTVENKNIYQKY